MHHHYFKPCVAALDLDSILFDLSLNIFSKVEGAAALELNSTATAGATEATDSQALPVGGATRRELASTSSSAHPAPAPVTVPYTKASRTSLRPSVPRGPSRRQIMKLLPEDLRSALTAAGLDEHLEGLCEYFCALPGPDDAAALQGYLNPGSSSSANSGTSDGSTNKSSSSSSSASIAAGSCHDGSASAGNFNSKGSRRVSRRSSSSSNSSSSSSGGEVSKLADNDASEEDVDPGSASGPNFTMVMATVVSGLLSDRRITPRAPEWKLCRRVLAAVNPLWRIARTHVAVGPDGRLEAVSQLLARASEGSVARLQELGLAPDEVLEM